MEPYNNKNHQYQTFAHQQDVNVLDILKLETKSKNNGDEGNSLFYSKKHDFNELSERIMVRVPYSSTISSDNEEENDRVTDYNSSFIPFDVSVFKTKVKNKLKGDEMLLLSEMKPESKIQHSNRISKKCEKVQCKCKCALIAKSRKALIETKRDTQIASPAVPSREFNFTIPNTKLRTQRSDDCFGNLQKIKLRRSLSAQNFRTVNNSKTHYSTFRPQSAINPTTTTTTTTKKLTVPKVLNIQPENIFKEHTLPVGRQTMKTLRYINNLHQKELIMRKEKSRQSLSTMVVLSEDLEDLCIKPVINRPQSAQPVMFSSRRWEKSGEKLVGDYQQEYRISARDRLKKEIDDVARVNCSCNDQEPNTIDSCLKNEKRKISSSASSKICIKSNKVLQRVKFEQNI